MSIRARRDRRRNGTGEGTVLRGIAGNPDRFYVSTLLVVVGLVFLVPALLGRSREEADERSMQLLERVGLKEKAGQHPGRCSGGQQQRIAIARALALDPSIMLFDEPTSALDPEVGLEVLSVMRELAADGMTMVVVTHEMDFARNVADHVLYLDRGRIVEQGQPRAILENPEHPRTRAFLKRILER